MNDSWISEENLVMETTKVPQTGDANIASPIVMCLTGTIGNAIAIFVLHRNSRREQMRTVFYVLVGSLAWTDLTGIILTTIPVLLFYVNKRWVGGQGLCNYHAFVMISIGVITPCIVCTMAVERYIGIRHGYFYKKHVNRSRIRLILFGQWIFVLIFASFPFFGFGRYTVQYPGSWCFFNLHPESGWVNAYAYTFAILILFFILVIIVCNIAVIATLIGMRHRRKHLNSPSKERQIHRSPRQREIEIQMVILLVGITLLFTTCWAPLMIQILVNQLVGHGDDHTQDLLTIRLVSINQTFDPWVYILFRKVIFTKFWKYLRRLCLGHFDPAHSEAKKMAAAQSLLQNNGDRCSSYRYHPRKQRAALRLDMPMTVIACRGLIVTEKDNAASKAGSTPEFGSKSNSSESKRVDFELTLDECRTDKDQPLIYDSALEMEVEYDENLSATIAEVFHVDAKDASVVMLPNTCQSCSRKLQNGNGLVVRPLDGNRSKSWTAYLDAFPKLNGFFAKNQRLNAPVSSEAPQTEDLQPVIGSVRSAIL